MLVTCMTVTSEAYLHVGDMVDCMAVVYRVVFCVLQGKRNEYQFHLEKQLQKGEVVTFRK